MQSVVRDDRLVTEQAAALADCLSELATLLQTAGVARTSASMRRLEGDARSVRDADDLSTVATRVLLICRGGMGTFPDLVLMENDHVSPAQDRFDRLRRELFELAREVR